MVNDEVRMSKQFYEYVCSIPRKTLKDIIPVVEVKPRYRYNWKKLCWEKVFKISPLGYWSLPPWYGRTGERRWVPYVKL